MVLIATDLALTVQRCSLLRIRVSTPAVLTALTGTAEEIDVYKRQDGTCAQASDACHIRILHGICRRGAWDMPCP